MKEFRVAIIGQIARWKGQDVFIKAAKLLHRKYPEIKFLIIGDVLFAKEEELQYKNHLIELAKDCNYIQFLGHRENVLELLKDIDILVHASTRAEPFGRVIIEGMASRKPVIAAGIGGPLEIIEDGISGILYAPGNDIALAEELACLLKDNNKRNRIAEGGYKRFQKKFNLRTTVEQVERLILLQIR
ncbi:glycosyltransferase family 4 protein [Niallia circulans]|uniref:glycosyltransferase family 4 protein n=1 Tax=Niallia circulans TaxID=1397 RepID=UPI002E1DC7DD|nr:glycosyltransferase family 4 protein [Niallia circulans]